MRAARCRCSRIIRASALTTTGTGSATSKRKCTSVCHMKIVTTEDKKELGRQAAQHGADLLRRALKKNGRANIIVATGASQFEMLATLANEKIDWHDVTAF